MGLRINTNVSALNAHRQLGMTDANMSRAMERLSSGYRINRAKDDAAGLAISQKLNTQARSNEVASRNTTQANSMLQVAEGGADQIHNILLRLKELATQASSSNNTTNLSDINNEATALKSEIDRIANSTTYMGTSLLTGYGVKCATDTLSAVGVAYGLDVSGAAAHTFSVVATTSVVMTMTDTTTGVSQAITRTEGAAQTFNFSTFGIKFNLTAAANSVNLISVASALSDMVISTNSATFQIGDQNTSNYQISFQIDDMQQAAISVTGVDLTSLAAAQTALTSIDNAIAAVSTSRGKIGALQNRLDFTFANLQTATENISAAASVIKDVDMAAEMVTFTKTQILMQAGTAMLGQANMASQGVLSLIGGR